MSEKDLEEVEEEESQPDIIEKVKKARSQKQIDAFIAVRAKRDENRKGRAEVRVKDAEIRTKIVEEKIVKKALAIKKKQILRDFEIDSITDDDDIPVEMVKKIMTKYKRKPVAVHVPVHAPVSVHIPIAHSVPARPTYTFI